MDFRRDRNYEPTWKIVKTFIDGEFGVYVSQDIKSLRPKYNVQIGRVKSDGKLVSYVPVITEGTFQISIKSGLKAFGPLCEKAESWILEEVALRADSDVEKRIEKETKDLFRDKPVTRKTGKTEKKRAKLAARRPEVS